MKHNRVLFVLTCLVLLAVSLSSCTTWARRKPLEVEPYSRPLSRIDVDHINLVFEEVVPGKPLNETVWDNAIGPFWDVEESNQIGFTQDYTKFLPVAAGAGLIGGVIGGAIAGATAGPKLVNSRIVIPFGNIFSTTVESAISKSTEKHSTCYQPACEPQRTGANSLIIRINAFYVWEDPINHLNLLVNGKSRYSNADGVVTEYWFKKSVPYQKLGSVMSTHASSMREMNKISNLLAQDVSQDIMTNMFKTSAGQPEPAKTNVVRGAVPTQ
jgi:hypothetical protein